MADDSGDQSAPPPPVEVPLEVPAAEAAPPPADTIPPEPVAESAVSTPEPAETTVVEEVTTPAAAAPAPTTAQPQTLSSSDLPARGLAARRARKDAKLQKILALAREKEFITNDDVEKLLHVSNKTATRYLNELIKQGKLQRVGSESHAQYKLL